MNEWLNLNDSRFAYLVGTVAVVGTSLVVAHKMIRRRRVRIKVDKDVVVLHQIPRGPYAPSLSPFPIKLETFLRIAGIKYVNDFDFKVSSEGKIPWITLNGVDVPDSYFSIKHLKEHFGIDLSAHLSAEQRAGARAIQLLVEDHLYWCLAYCRFVVDKEKIILKEGLSMPFKSLFLCMISRRALKQSMAQGIGRHTIEEIKHLLEYDLQTISDYLGSKKFMTGDTPTDVDCSVFGMIAQLIWHSKDPYQENLVQDKYPKLYDYALRLKAQFWKDWDECTMKLNKLKL